MVRLEQLNYSTNCCREIDKQVQRQYQQQDTRLKYKMEEDSSSKASNSQAKELSPGIEVDFVEKIARYKKMTGFATTHGQEFEVTLAALLFLRGLNSGLHFHLATNVKGAGAMDDVVFRFIRNEEPGRWQTMYVQLKHKERKPLSRTMLANPVGDFSLPSYFKSYLEIKQAMSTGKGETLFDGDLQDSLFVIFTNAKAGANLGELLNGNLNQAEKFLWTGSGSVFRFETDEDMLECLGDCGEEGYEFLSRLQVFCGQPSAIGLKAAVKEELAKMYPDMNLARVSECFLNHVKIWWETSNVILNRGHGILQSALKEVMIESEFAASKVRPKVELETCSEQTQKKYVLPLEFEDNDLLKIGDGVANVQSIESSCRLTLTKLVQGIEGKPLVLSCEQLTANQPALLTECKNGNVKRLVVITKDWRSEFSNEYLKTFNEILESRDTFSLVLLSDGEISIVSELCEKFQEKCTIYTDNFMISQLRQKSRDTILNKLVNLQGHEINLEAFFNNDYGCIDQVVNASMVVDILESEGTLAVGSALPEGIGYYVDRTLEQPCVKATMFPALQGTATIRITQSVASDRDLFDKAFDFLKSISDAPSVTHDDTQEIVNKLVQSPRLPDRNYSEVSTGQRYSLGCYECNCVGFRFGQENTDTALHVCLSVQAPQKISFLFVSNQANEEVVTKLSDFHQSEHLLSLKDGQLFSKFAPETAMDVEDRLVLVCAEPGMGKSTLMARLAKNTKVALPHCFVILITLNDHTKFFAERKHVDALEFLEIAAKMDSPLQRSLLKFALEVSGNVVVIADGLDEIAPKYVEQSCNLLSSILKKTKAIKIWITSRNSVKQILEKRFSICSVKLREFDKEDQKNFLKKYWAGKTSEENVIEFVDLLLEKSAQTIGNKERNFLGIPLQTRMLAEIYADHVTESAEKIELPDKLDLLSLVEQFVELKYNIYFRDKLKIAADDPNEEEIFKMCRKDFISSHANAALVLILGSYEIKSLGLGWILSESLTFFNDIKLGSYKTGFIDEIVSDKPRFIHRVFAEYFVANWIAKDFACNLEFVKSKMFTPDFTVIRYFFNGILSNGCVLHKAVLQENIEEVKTLLESEDTDVEDQDTGGRNALHLAASLGASENRKEKKRRCEILDLIIGKTSDFKVVDDILCSSPLRYADITRWWTAIDKLLCKTDDNGQLVLTLEDLRDGNMLGTIFQNDLDKLLGFCLDNGLDVEHRYIGTGFWTERETRLLVKACETGGVKVASLLIKRHANINTTEDDFKFASGPLILASSRGHLEIVKLLCDKYISTLPSSSLIGEADLPEASKYINMKDKYGRTAIHHAAVKDQADVINFLMSQGGDTQSRDRYNKTPLHMAAEFNAPTAMGVLLEAVNEADRPAAVNSYNKFGQSVLHLAVMRGCLKCVQLLIQAGGRLSLVNKDKETLLMTAALGGKKRVVELLLDNFKSDREGMTLEGFIYMKDSGGRTALDRADTKCRKVIEHFGK